MMGIHDGQQEMFNSAVNLDRRVRADHPLQAVRAALDFTFVRAEVAHCYRSCWPHSRSGCQGNALQPSGTESSTEATGSQHQFL